MIINCISTQKIFAIDKIDHNSFKVQGGNMIEIGQMLEKSSHKSLFFPFDKQRERGIFLFSKVHYSASMRTNGSRDRVSDSYTG